MDNLFAKLTHRTRRTALLSAAGAAGLLLTSLCLSGFGCTNNETPSISESFNKAEFQVGEAVEGSAHYEQLLADIEAARDSVDIAVSRLEDTTVAEALVAAHNRGVTVRVVSDWDSWASGMNADAGLLILEQADVLPTYGDGELQYLPDPMLASIMGACSDYDDEQYRSCTQGQDSVQGVMVRPGAFNLMSHNFAIIDGMTVWNFPELNDTNQPWVGWRIESSILAYDFRSEFQQMFGGVFASTLDVYNGPVKSNTNASVQYFTDQGRMRVLFNPQERLVKTMIDEVYKAQASVWVMSDNISDPQMLKALEYKAANGFDVRVMFHPSHQASGSPLNRLNAVGGRVAPAELDHLPTLMVIDQEIDRNGRKRPRSVISLSHSLWHASPYEVVPGEPRPSGGLRNDSVSIYPSDLFVDGNMWVLSESGSSVHKDALLNDFVAAWLKTWEL